MKKFFKGLFHSKTNQSRDGFNPLPPDGFQIDNEVQSLRIELEAAQKQSEHLKQEIDRIRSRQNELIELTIQSRLESLFSELSGPASQILTQADLFENHAKPVQAGDVLSVAKRMVRALERNGLVITGRPGDQVSFDPNRHTPINQSQIEVGQPVSIRFAGMAYEGKMIYKAIVE